jgi:hypothetical protein
MDYGYVLEPDRLRVLTNRAGGWQPVAVPAWTEPPDWDAIDQHAQRSAAGGTLPVRSHVRPLSGDQHHA